MTNRKGINVAAAATIAAAWLGWWLLAQPRPPKFDRRPHEALGAALAAEAVQRLEPGARIVVFARDPDAFEVPGCAAQLEAFLRAVKKSGHDVAGVRGVKLDPLRLAAVPPGDFFDQMRLGRDNDVIVSFLGPPVLDAQQVAKLGARRPQVLAVCSGSVPAQVNLQRLFAQRLLTLAVISRTDVSPGLAAAPAQAAFERMFKIFTAANADELPAGHP